MLEVRCRSCAATASSTRPTARPLCWSRWARPRSTAGLTESGPRWSWVDAHTPNQVLCW